MIYINNIKNVIANIITNDNLSFKINNVRLREFPKDYNYKNHRHQSIEINYIKKGSCYMKFKKEIVHFKENECMLIYPGFEHYFYTGSNENCIIFQLDFNISNFFEYTFNECFEKELIFLYELKIKENKFVKFLNINSISACIENILKEFNDKKQNYDVLLKLHFCELLIIISRDIKEQIFKVFNLKNEYIKYTLSYIGKNYNEKIDIELIALQCGITSRYLRQIFKKEFNMTIMDYITILRINKAKELMREISLNLTDISCCVGYSNQQYFSKVFKEREGLSPKSYRKLLFRKV